MGRQGAATAHQGAAGRVRRRDGPRHEMCSVAQRRPIYTHVIGKGGSACGRRGVSGVGFSLVEGDKLHQEAAHSCLTRGGLDKAHHV
jgi:hypothetical protein